MMNQSLNFLTFHNTLRGLQDEISTILSQGTDEKRIPYQYLINASLPTCACPLPHFALRLFICSRCACWWWFSFVPGWAAARMGSVHAASKLTIDDFAGQARFLGRWKILYRNISSKLMMLLRWEGDRTVWSGLLSKVLSLHLVWRFCFLAESEYYRVFSSLDEKKSHFRIWWDNIDSRCVLKWYFLPAMGLDHSQNVCEHTYFECRTPGPSFLCLSWIRHHR